MFLNICFNNIGMEISRSYTPVVPSLEINEESSRHDSSHIVFMIKIYPAGTFTPLLNVYNIGKFILPFA